MSKRMLALVSCGLLLVLPAWPASDPIGHVTVARGAEVSGVEVTPGTTVFDGDRVTVPGGGLATLDLRGGSVVEMTGGTDVYLAEHGKRVDVRVNRGGVRLTSSGKLTTAGRVADLVFSPASPGAGSVGLVRLEDGTKVLLLAERGDWVAYTADNRRTVTVRPGEELRGEISADAAQETEGAQEKKKKKRKLGVIWIGTAVAGTATGLGMAFGMSECNVNSGPCPPSPVVSPVAP